MKRAALRRPAFERGPAYWVFFSSFVVSVDEDVEPEGLEALDEDDGVLLEPAPAEPLTLELDEEGVLPEAPPLAWSFLLMSIDVELDCEVEPDGEVLEEPGVAALLEELPGVVDGVAVLPAADEDDAPEGEVDGEAVEPAGAVVVVDELDAPAGRSLA